MITSPRSIPRGEERNHEFEAAYCRAMRLKLGGKATMPKRIDDDALKMAIETCHTPYDVSYDRAYRVINALLRGKKPWFNSAVKNKMWAELAEKVRRAITLTHCSHARAIEHVLEYGRTSQLFRSEHTARLLLRWVTARPRSLDSIARAN